MKCLFSLLFLLSPFFFLSAEEAGASSKEADNEKSEEILNLSQTEEYIDIFSEMDLIDLINFEIVSATKKSQKISDAPAVIAVIDSKQIRQRGYQTVGEALKSLPGIDVLEDYLHPNVGVRGVNGGMRAWSKNLKVMIDGQPVSFRPSSENWLGEELIPIEIIERIEVIRGPSSALYGANAYLGVVNIITKDAKKLQNAQIAGKAGYIHEKLNKILPKILHEIPTYGGTVSGGYLNEGFDMVLSFGGIAADRSGVGPKPIPGIPFDPSIEGNLESKDDTLKAGSAFAKMGYQNKKVGNIRADFLYQLYEKAGEFQDYGVFTHITDVSMYNFYARLQFEHELKENLYLSLSGAYAKGAPTDKDKLYSNKASLLYVTRDLSYNGADLAGEIWFTLKDSSIFTAGVDYTFDQQTLVNYIHHVDEIKPVANTDESIFDGKKDFTNRGIYIQAVIYPFDLLNIDYGSLDALGITGGLRYDFHNIYGNVFNYRAALVYKPLEEVFIKILYGTSFKAPSSVQLYDTNIGTDITGNPDLKPEKASTIEGVLGGKLFDFINLSLTGFYNIITDKVEFDKQSGYVIIRPWNISETSSYGFEIELMSGYKKFITGYTNFSYQKSIFKQDLYGEKIEQNAPIYPAMMVKFGLNSAIEIAHVNINLEGQYIGKRISSPQNTAMFDPIPPKVGYELDPYFIANLTLSSTGIKFLGENETIMTLKINNLLNTEYFFPGFNGKCDIPAPKINFMLTVLQQF